MGSLTLPQGGFVYLDTSTIIYSVERHEPYFTLLAPLWQRAAAGQFVIVCSELVLAEVLVQPIRQGNRSHEQLMRSVLTAPEVTLVATTRQLWEDTARLRAATGLKTPDALHATTALRSECALFVTNDSDFRRVERLPVVILDDLL